MVYVGDHRRVSHAPEILQGLGIVPNPGSTTFTFEDPGGNAFDLDLTPIPLDPKVPPRFVSAAAVPLLARRMPPPRSGTRSCRTPKRSTSIFGATIHSKCNARQLFEFIDAHPVTRLVIDLRRTAAGTSSGDGAT